MTVSDWIALSGLLLVVIGSLIAHERRDAKRQRESDKAFSHHRTVLIFLCKKNGINGDLIQSLEKD